MKILTVTLILTVSASLLAARQVNLPIDSRQVSLVYLERNDLPFPECRADIRLDGQSGKITSISITIDGVECLIPEGSLRVLPSPSISSMGMQAEVNRDDEVSIVLVMEPSEEGERREFYQVAIVGDRYSHVSKTWEGLDGDSGRRHSEILHKEE